MFNKMSWFQVRNLAFSYLHSSRVRQQVAFIGTSFLSLACDQTRDVSPPLLSIVHFSNDSLALVSIQLQHICFEKQSCSPMASVNALKWFTPQSKHSWLQFHPHTLTLGAYKCKNLGLSTTWSWQCIQVSRLLCPTYAVECPPCIQNYS